MKALKVDYITPCQYAPGAYTVYTYGAALHFLDASKDVVEAAEKAGMPHDDPLECPFDLSGNAGSRQGFKLVLTPKKVDAITYLESKFKEWIKTRWHTDLFGDTKVRGSVRTNPLNGLPDAAIDILLNTKFSGPLKRVSLTQKAKFNVPDHKMDQIELKVNKPGNKFSTQVACTIDAGDRGEQTFNNFGLTAIARRTHCRDVVLTMQAQISELKIMSTAISRNLHMDHILEFEGGDSSHGEEVSMCNYGDAGSSEDLEAARAILRKKQEEYAATAQARAQMAGGGGGNTGMWPQQQQQQQWTGSYGMGGGGAYGAGMAPGAGVGAGGFGSGGMAPGAGAGAAGGFGAAPPAGAAGGFGAGTAAGGFGGGGGMAPGAGAAGGFGGGGGGMAPGAGAAGGFGGDAGAAAAAAPTGAGDFGVGAAPGAFGAPTMM